MKKTISLTAIIYLALLNLCTAQVSIETLGAIRSVNIGDREQYGAGVDVGYKLNSFVTAHVRAISYSDNSWRGSVIDEGSALIEARLLNSANNRLSLSAIGGADRDFQADDWGFSVGARGTAKLVWRLSLFGESRIRAWFNQRKDLITTAGIQLPF